MSEERHYFEAGAYSPGGDAAQYYPVTLTRDHLPGHFTGLRDLGKRHGAAGVYTLQSAKESVAVIPNPWLHRGEGPRAHVAGYDQSACPRIMVRQFIEVTVSGLVQNGRAKERVAIRLANRQEETIKFLPNCMKIQGDLLV